MKKIDEKIFVPIVVTALIAFITLFVLIFLSLTIWKRSLSISASQVDNTQQIILNWEVSGDIDSLEIQVSHQDDLVYYRKIKNKKEIQKGTATVDAFYGKQTVKIKINNKFFSTSKIKTVALTTSEYVIAPITATMPVTLFSLSLKEITKDYSIPTFVWFKRGDVWDYDKLPNNVYPVPVATKEQIKDGANQKVMYKKTSSWIKELYELNKESYFNLYYNDYYAYGWLDATIANGIPKENYEVTLLSDGVASFAYFNEHFDNPDAKVNYAIMKKEYNALKLEIAKRGYYKENSDKFTIDALALREYAYVMAKEEDNLNWWVTRINGTMANNNKEIYEELENTSSVLVKDLKTMFETLTEDEQNSLKKLFNFSNNVFEKASNYNKKIMVILGTWTEEEYEFSAYVNAVRKYYGDEYIYYYKGHPKNPTNQVKDRDKLLESLDLIDLDATIPFELFLFFNEDIYISGYMSTTFISVSPEKCCSLFHQSKDEFSEVYKDNLDFFITNSNLEKYENIIDEDSYVLEFNNNSYYDIAVYNYEKDTLIFYKLVSGTYEEVER